MSEVKVEITANTSMLATGLAKAQKNIESFGKDITSNITDKLAGAFAGGAVLAGIGMLASGIVQAGKDVLDFAGNLQDTSEALGVTAEQLQGLESAFLLGGAGAEDVKKSLGKLSQAIADAQQNVGPARDAFDKLGVSFSTIASGDTNAVLMEIANGVRNSSNPVQAYAAALDLLGKSGIKMIPGLKGGADSIKELSDAASKLSDKQVADIAAIGDKLDWLSKKWLVIKAGFFLGTNTTNTQGAEATAMSIIGGGFDPSKFKGPSGAVPTAGEMFKPTMAELNQPVDPKIKAAAEAQAKMDDENQKKADAYAEKQLKAAEKIGDMQIKNAQDAEEARRSQLTVEEEINALLNDRINLESEVANSIGEQQALAQKDLQDVQKLIDAKTAARDSEARARDKDQTAIDAENAKKIIDHKKKVEEIAGAEKKAAEDIAKAKEESKKREASIISTMAEEEMKTPMQRANEDRIAREKKRIERSIERRIEKGALSGTSSNAMQKLKGELDENRKDLPKEVAKLTDELKIAVKKLNAA
jgi:hypothetical protein